VSFECSFPQRSCAHVPKDLGHEDLRLIFAIYNLKVSGFPSSFLRNYAETGRRLFQEWKLTADGEVCDTPSAFFSLSLPSLGHTWLTRNSCRIDLNEQTGRGIMMAPTTPQSPSPDENILHTGYRHEYMEPGAPAAQGDYVHAGHNRRPPPG